jgi:predicted permease
MLPDLLRDLRYGLRSLRRSPGFTALVTITLAVGIGANAAIFSLVNFVLLRSLPVRDPGGLVLFSGSFSAGSSGPKLERGPIRLYSYPLYQRLRDDGAAFRELAAQDSGHTTALVTGTDGTAELGSGRAVSARYFAVLGVPAWRGRTFLPEDETGEGANPVVVLSHRFWLRRFHGDPALIGGRLKIGPTTYTVVGVTAPGFTGTRVGVEVSDFWVPMTMQADLTGQRTLDRGGHQSLVIVGRLQEGVSLPAAQAVANAILQRFLEAHPDLLDAGTPPQAVCITLVPGGRGIRPLDQPGVRMPLLLVAAAVALLLVVVCLNVSHLQLARSVGRQREMGVRAALGASGWRLMRQTLAEGLLLALLGGAGAVLATGWFIRGLLSLIPADLPLTIDVGVDPPVLAMIAALALGTTLVLGLVPATQAWRANLQGAMRGGARLGLGRLLLVGQVTASLVLLVEAGLLGGSLSRLRDVAMGFEQKNLLLLGLKPSLTTLTPDDLEGELLRQVTALPGVRSASLSTFPLLDGAHARSWAAASPGASVTVEDTVVTPQYFATMGMTLVRGRGLLTADRQGARLVAVVNETLARRFWGGSSEALGAALHFPGPSGQGPGWQVVGVVADARNDGLRDPAAPNVFRPLAQSPRLLGSLEVRTTGDPAVADSVRQAIRAAFPQLPITYVRTMRGQVERALTGERSLAGLTGAFGLTALLLVCLGLYGGVSQWAARRTREIGVRVALGATAMGVRWLVLRQALGIALLGVMVGLPVAVAVARLLRSLLYGLQPTDPGVLAGGALLPFAVAALAAYLPARRASRADPMAALRAD